jgi:hypothetical protein
MFSPQRDAFRELDRQWRIHQKQRREEGA